jgi:hypothetical protein
MTALKGRRYEALLPNGVAIAPQPAHAKICREVQEHKGFATRRWVAARARNDKPVAADQTLM